MGEDVTLEAGSESVAVTKALSRNIESIFFIDTSYTSVEVMMYGGECRKRVANSFFFKVQPIHFSSKYNL